MKQRKLDLTTVGGLLIALLGIGVGYLLEGGEFAALLAVSPILIIFGGTIGVVAITMNQSDVKNIPKLIKIIFTDANYDFQELINNMCEWTKVSRRDGIVALGKIATEIEDPFIKRGIEYILDGSDYETIKELLEKEVEAMMERHHTGSKPFEQAGGFSPTMGIIGTVLGLVVVLGGLGGADIEELGHGIATAFIATLMGVAFANLAALPFAETLKGKSSKEVLYKDIAIQGILGIQTGTNPKILRKKLVANLPESMKAEETSNEKEKE
ncbi:motility protein A [Bacillus toyonensis]|uniref:motility protein A n=1 Tax=Bacillus toyonensis TaxID=155322 RepID=UPI002E2433C2|nr:MotA/TolQ/ExbB proton channel family protein [Bacillus toyonensis]